MIRRDRNLDVKTSGIAIYYEEKISGKAGFENGYY